MSALIHLVEFVCDLHTCGCQRTAVEAGFPYCVGPGN